jgi:hypothetical protein
VRAPSWSRAHAGPRAINSIVNGKRQQGAGTPRENERRVQPRPTHSPARTFSARARACVVPPKSQETRTRGERGFRSAGEPRHDRHQCAKMGKSNPWKGIHCPPPKWAGSHHLEGRQKGRVRLLLAPRHRKDLREHSRDRERARVCVTKLKYATSLFRYVF